MGTRCCLGKAIVYCMVARRVWQYAAKAVMMDGDPEGWPQQVSRDCTRNRLAQRRQYVQLYQRRLLARRRHRLPSLHLPSPDDEGKSASDREGKSPLDEEGKSASEVEAPHQACLLSLNHIIATCGGIACVCQHTQYIDASTHKHMKSCPAVAPSIPSTHTAGVQHMARVTVGTVASLSSGCQHASNVVKHAFAQFHLSLAPLFAVRCLKPIHVRIQTLKGTCKMPGRLTL